MALSAYPFENANTTEDQYTLLFRNFAGTGIVGNYGDSSFLVTTDGSGLDVQVAAGYAIIRGHAVQNDGPVTVNIAAADTQFPRLDRLVLRLDPDADGISLVVIKGTPNANPVAPPLVQTNVDVYDLPLAVIRVSANALNVVATDITSERTWGSHRFGVWSTATRPTSPMIGQPGFNVDTAGAEVWSGTKWESVNSKKRTVIPHTFTLAGPIAPANGDDYYVPGFFVPVPSGQSVRLLGTRCRINSGTSVGFQLRRNGAVVYGPVTATTTTTNPGSAGILFSDGDELRLEVTSIAGNPKNLQVTCFLEYEV